MAREQRWAGAPGVRPPRRSARAARRSWRRRSRRAQVSAVATILGLLLVVTFIANYLSTTLPNTMGQNDLQHELAVENQVAQLSARVQATAVAGAFGAQVTQPVSLGSQGAPPFAAPDGASLTALSSAANTTGNRPQSSVSFQLLGPSSVQVPVTLNGTSGFTVHFANTYAPLAEVAYDQGSVVFAQPGGTPIFIVPPSITFVSGVLTIFVPWFSNSVAGEAGTGTADASLRLLSTTSLTVPSNGFSFVSGSSLTFQVVSPYAAGWFSYLDASTAFQPYPLTCSGSNNVCNAPYNPFGIAPLGQVTLVIPTSAILQLNILTAVYAIQLA